jgi:hypothetical protein
LHLVLAAAAAAYFWHMIHLAVVLYASPLYWKQDYHTSALMGKAWVDELIVGHPDRIKSELGMWVHVFLALVAQLRFSGNVAYSKNIMAEEQVAIFLYTCVTGLSIRHVGERFQHSDETISKYLSPFSGRSGAIRACKTEEISNCVIWYYQKWCHRACKAGG